MGSGTFVGSRPVGRNDVERRRVLDQLCQEFLSRVSTHGFTLEDILENLEQRMVAEWRLAGEEPERAGGQ